MLSEFELIARYFTRPTRHTVLGIGDDAALLAVTPGHELVASTDVMVEGAHFSRTRSLPRSGTRR
jgi:thiamine-monophosphate kinase